jgi:hypothetical protein
LYRQAQLADSEVLLRRALRIVEEVYGPEHPELAIPASNLGQILHAKGDLEERSTGPSAR